ncbi:MAG TPA: ArsA-related P-loop ATPase [Ilumatobacteraceae bacterium]|nr:ArsA-related P-loop ATPase [Ilumatobacteraceae bacterium]
MEPGRLTPEWLGRTRVLFVVGKGGVGTSTVAASLAVLAARGGADVLLVSVDGKAGLGPLLGGVPLGPTEQPLRAGTFSAGYGRIRGRTITPKQAFGDYLELKGFGGILRRAASAASLDLIAGATPGMEHLLVLGKIKELDRLHAADLIIVDAPPAGHATPFLRSASALQVAVANGPVRDQADEVAELLADHARCQCVMVTLAEETPVNEVIELAHDLEETLGLALAPLVVNGCWPQRAGLTMTAAAAARKQKVTLSVDTRRAIDDVVRFGRARQDLQAEQFARLDAQLPLPRVHLPRLPVARLLPEHLDVLADALAVEPATPASAAK